MKNKIAITILLLSIISASQSYSSTEPEKSPNSLFAPTKPGWLDNYQHRRVQKTRKVRVKPVSSHPRVKSYLSYPRALPKIRRVKPSNQ